MSNVEMKKKYAKEMTRMLTKCHFIISNLICEGKKKDEELKKKDEKITELLSILKTKLPQFERDPTPPLLMSSLPGLQFQDILYESKNQ